MKCEKRIKEFSLRSDEAGFKEFQEYCKVHGTNPYVVDDQITLKELPIEFKELIKSYGIDFQHFIVSGYHGLRYGKGTMLLCGIYEYEIPAKDKAFEVDLKALFHSDNVLKMYVTAARDLNGEENDGKVFVKVTRPSDIVEDVLSSMRNYVWDVIHTVKDESGNNPAS